VIEHFLYLLTKKRYYVNVKGNMPDGTSAPIDNSLPPIPQKKAATFGDMAMGEKLRNQALKLQSEGKLNPSIAKTFGIELNKPIENTTSQVPQASTAETPIQPPTPDENEKRISEIQNIRQAQINAKNIDIQKFAKGEKTP
jgi:hypothetical protein